MDYQTESALERIQRFGIQSVSAIDLLAILIAENQEKTIEAENSARLWIQKNNIQKIMDLSLTELKELGLEDIFLAQKALAGLELGRRAGHAGTGPAQYIEEAEDVVKLFGYLKSEKKEHFCAVYLNSKNRVLCTRTIHIGTVNMSLAGPREIFREAIREGAASLIAVHNHPSGDPVPSIEDIHITKKLKESGSLLGIPMLDHIILGHQCYYSFQEKGSI